MTSLHEMCNQGGAEGAEGAAAAAAFLEALQEQSPDDVLYCINLRNDQRYTPLHVAIFARNLDAVETLIKYGADVDVKCHGTPPVHLVCSTAAQPGGLPFAVACLGLLLAAQANPMAKDDHGFSAVHICSELDQAPLLNQLLSAVDEPEQAVCMAPKLTGICALHLAACSDAAQAAAVLLDRGAEADERSAALGLSPLHMAGAYGCVRVWRLLMERAVEGESGSGGALPHLSLMDALGRTPLQLAQECGYCVGEDPALLQPAAPLLQALRVGAKTAIVTNPLCSQHFTCPPSQADSPAHAPPENTKRLQVLLHETEGSLMGGDLAHALHWVRDARPAVLADVLRVHEWSYVRRVQGKCASIASADPEDESAGYAHLDGDTVVTADTFNAALAAAGSVCEAVDLVARGQARNAFCPVRPPGHHAGPRGLVKGDEGGPDSHGFCILNNVSIGAAYAMNRYRESVKKVAIIDFDVHHGNGTEETVRWLKPSVELLPFNASSSSVSGPEVFGALHQPRYKPWHSEQDVQNVMFVSVHGYGPRERELEHLMPRSAFYPGSGKTSLPEVPVPSPTPAPVSAPSSSSAVAKGASAAAGGGGSAGPMDQGGEDEEKGEEDDEDEDEDEDEDASEGE
ncbi:hypothetical protein B484DRAFT_349729, partial [Ochromonadaceae sp. CCMP2298]